MTKLTYLPAQPIGDETYCLQLGPAQIMELETGRRPGSLRNVSVMPQPIYSIFASIMSGRIDAGNDGSTGNPFASCASEGDIRNIVRLGLEGGGLDMEDAVALVRENGPPHQPLGYLWDIAAALVYAHVHGVEADG